MYKKVTIFCYFYLLGLRYVKDPMYDHQIIKLKLFVVIEYFA